MTKEKQIIEMSKIKKKLLFESSFTGQTALGLQYQGHTSKGRSIRIATRILEVMQSVAYFPALQIHDCHTVLVIVSLFYNLSIIVCIQHYFVLVLRVQNNS